MRRHLQQTLKVRDLRVVHAIALRGSIIAASRALGLTQPAMSKALKSIEAALGLALFERTAFGVTPTAAGHAVLDCAARVLGEVAALEQTLGELDERRAPMAGGQGLSAARCEI